MTLNDKPQDRFRFYSVSRYGYFVFPGSTSRLPVGLSFEDLSSKYKGKFRNAGIRPLELPRSIEDAERLYQKVPRYARTSERNLIEFLATKDASHIKSHGKEIINKQDGFNELNSSENLVWESAKVNRKRGSRTMSKQELLQLTVANNNEATMLLLMDAAVQGARGAAIGAMMELPLATFDDLIIHDGEVSLRRVTKRVAFAGLCTGAAASLSFLLLAQVPEDMLQSESMLYLLQALSIASATAWAYELAARVSLYVRLRMEKTEAERRKLLVLVL